MKQLDIMCGNIPRQREGYEIFGIDIAKSDKENIAQADLVWDKIPYPDNSFELVTCYDGLEHLPKVVHYPFTRERHSTSGILGTYHETKYYSRNVIVELLNEIYRVLTHNGIFFVQVPKFPSWGAIADPQHVSFWIPDSLNYLSGDYFGTHELYGHTSRFEKLWCEDWNNGVHMRFELRAIKSVPNDYPYKLQY